MERTSVLGMEELSFLRNMDKKITWATNIDLLTVYA